MEQSYTTHNGYQRAAKEVAPGIWRISLLPYDLLNVYLLEDVLVDAGPGFTLRRLLHALHGREVRALALSHAHFDHQGASWAVCERLDIPLWCGRGEREAIEAGYFHAIMPSPTSPVARLNQFLAGPGHHVDRVLKEGDVVGGFVVIETPGHTPGHLSFWRESDRVLVVGDTLFNRSRLTLLLGLQKFFRSATYCRFQNRESARRLMNLKPDIICFGHGSPLTDSSKFRRLDEFLN